jgi:hypothetical protein
MPGWIVWCVALPFGAITAITYLYIIFRFQRTGRISILKALEENRKYMADLERDKTIPFTTRLCLWWFIQSMIKDRLIRQESFHEGSEPPPAPLYVIRLEGQRFLALS